jgi:hypothetical protein
MKMSRFSFIAGVFLAFILAAASTGLAKGRVTDVAITIDPSSLQSRVCPVTVVFNGYIEMDGIGTVTYQIIRSDGGTSAIRTAHFIMPGTHSIRETWTLGDAAALPNYDGWMAIRVLTPNPVESSHAAANFVMTCNSAPVQPPPPPQRARFRVSLTGFTSFRETRDNLLELDGPGDEIYQAPYVVIVDRIGGPTTRTIGAHGPVFRGIRTGTSFPTSTPWVLSGSPTGLGVPGLLFEGELIEGERAVAIAPTLWEWDDDHRQLLRFWGAAAAAGTRIASSVIPIMTGPFPARNGGLGTALDGLISSPITPEGDFDRPIGITVSGSAGSFTPKFLLLTYEGAMVAATGGAVFEVDYTDPDSHCGDYTLFVKVEQIP